MYIKKIKLTEFRAFQAPFELELSQGVTCISGLNGIGKSTILTVLTNTSELKKKDGSQLNGSLFRGDFSDLIQYDKKNDTSGDKVTIDFENIPKSSDDETFVSSLSFRAATQKYIKPLTKYIDSKQRMQSPIPNDGDGISFRVQTLYLAQNTDKQITRYRLIPKRVKGQRNTERKLNWPSAYLGLSRLYPIGETEDAQSNKLKIESDVSKEIIELHKNILSEKFNSDTASIDEISIDNLSKNKTGINTDSYQSTSNSSGQDNLGQILLSVISFKKLKNEIGDKYHGGILAIDEIDATLHPAAQFKLLDYLIDQSKELELQIVFTTHSQTLLNYINDLRRQPGISNNVLKNCYLKQEYDHPEQIDCIENPSNDIMKFNLSQIYAGTNQLAKPVPIFSEDDTARWFLNSILSKMQHANFNIKILEIDAPFNTLATIASSDENTYSNDIFIFDPDVIREENFLKISTLLRYTSFELNTKNSNLLSLPGPADPIEKIMADYVVKLDSNHIFFKTAFARGGYDKQMAIEHSAENDSRFKDIKGTKKYKDWFSDFAPFRDLLIESWIEDNKSDCRYFVNHLSNALKEIDYRSQSLFN